MPAVTGLSKIQQLGPMLLRANKHANGGIAGGEQGNGTRPRYIFNALAGQRPRALFRRVVIRAARGQVETEVPLSVPRWPRAVR